MSEAIPRARISTVDQIRGATVLFISISHFAAALHGMPRATHIGVVTGFVASPILVALCAFFSDPRGLRSSEPGDARRWTLLDRGLFFVTLGHAMDCLTLYGWGWTGGWLNRVELTDAIGIGLILQAVLPESPRLKLSLGLAGFASYIGLRFFWSDHTDGASVLHLLLMGGSGKVAAGFPVLPWLSFFLVCAAAATPALLLIYRADAHREATIRTMVRFAAALGAGAALSVGTYAVLRDHVSAPIKKVLYMLLHPGMKMPPSIGYYFTWLAAGSVLVALILQLQPYKVWQKYFAPHLVPMGRQVFAMLMLGWVLYEQIMWRIGPMNILELGLFFAASLAIHWYVAVLIEQTLAHRWMTVGITRFFNYRGAAVGVTG